MSRMTDSSLGIAPRILVTLRQYGQYPGMEVAVPVTRYTECQCPTMTVAATGAVTVALVAGKAFFLQILPPIPNGGRLGKIRRVGIFCD